MQKLFVIKGIQVKLVKLKAALLIVHGWFAALIPSDWLEILTSASQPEVGIFFLAESLDFVSE